MKLNNKKLNKIKGDASFRTFYRLRSNKKNSIIVFAYREKEKNLLIYDAINSLLNKSNILAPKLLNENYKRNYIEIEDFGNLTFSKILKKKGSNKIKIFKDIIILLNKIQKIKKNKIRNFKGQYYKIEKYSNKKLFKEAEIFCDWYVKKLYPKHKSIKLNKLIKRQIKILLSKIRLKNNTFVHRDFHASNLMKYKNKIAVIDSQDALIGNRAYDLASFIDDVRLKSKIEFKNKIFDYYIYLNKTNISKSDFQNDFQILSVLRNLKIIGIFTRLSSRDNKRNYLKFIPHAWKLIELRLNNNLELFGEIKKVLDKNFPSKKRLIK